MNGVRGADFSSYQSVEAVKAAIETQHIAFGIVKLTEGLGYVNPLAPAQVRALHDGGCVAMAYHFGIVADGAAEWDFFELHAAALGIGHVAFDYEAPGVTDAMAQAFIRRAHQRGYKVGLYGSDGVARRRLGQDWTWAAHWSKTPPAYACDIWQFAPGANGAPDWDVFRGSSWSRFILKNERSPNPPVRRWWLHDRTPGVTAAARGPFRLPTLAAQLVGYSLRHPRSSVLSLERK